MGYNSRANGSIIITPPLSAREMREHPELDYGERTGSISGSKDAYVEIYERSTATEEGEIIIRTGIRIRPLNEDESFKRYNLDEDIQEIVSSFPGHQFDGIIECTGEDAELWAYKVKDGRVITLRAKIIWEEEE